MVVAVVVVNTLLRSERPTFPSKGPSGRGDLGAAEAQTHVAAVENGHLSVRLFGGYPKPTQEHGACEGALSELIYGKQRKPNGDPLMGVPFVFWGRTSLQSD